MSSNIILHHPTGLIHADIVLNGSKSIANRALLIQALCENPFPLANIPNAADTEYLQQCLLDSGQEIYAGAGGTTYRFLTAFYAVQEGRTVTLTGSERMHQRPIKVLVKALQQLGADIQYAGNDDYPPLVIKGKKLKGGSIVIPANVSSQYITALLLIAPTFSDGLTLHLEGTIVSLPYIEMTMSLMRYFGIDVNMEGNTIRVKRGKYIPREFFIEADWSAASYYYMITALAKEAEITLHGLESESLQGDSIIASIFQNFGVETRYQNHAIQLTKNVRHIVPSEFSYNFLRCPDLAQTVIALCAAMHIPAKFQGLQTLLIKETDRVKALDTELSKIGCRLISTEDDNWQLVKDTDMSLSIRPIFATYDDHRMAMCLAPLALKLDGVEIKDPEVVEKSYPSYWKDLLLCGFVIK